MRRLCRAVCEPLELRRLLNAPGTNYALAFDDEFSGSALDQTKWGNYLPWTNSSTGNNRFEGGSYLDYMVNSPTTISGVSLSSNVSESGGQLHLGTQSVSNFTVGSSSFTFTGAMLTTNPTFWTTYGYAEIRAELPTGAGNWPAFWSLSNGWPPENDIMEDWPATSTNHQGLYDMTSTWNNIYPAYFANNTFHTYGMKWGPGFENFYEDGAQTESITSSAVPSESMYFLLNSGIQSGQTGTYSNSNNNTLNVDYVRIYSYNPGGPAVANAGFNVAGGYTLSGGASIINGSTIGLTGTGDLHITSTGEADQIVPGLTPNTTYIFSGEGEIATSNLAGLIGVKNYSSGSGNVSSAIGNTGQSSPTWVLGSQSFTTGPTDTSATIYVRNANGSGTAVYFDDLSLVSAPVIGVNGAGDAVGTTVNVPIAQGSLGSFWNAASVTSSNTALVPNSGISLNAGKTALQVTPLAGQQGTTTITLTASNSDLFAGTVSSSFILTVLPTEAISGDGVSDAFRLVRDGAMVDVFVNNTTTTPTSQFNYSSFAVSSFSGLTANSSLVIDYSGGDPITTGGISWNGTGAGNLSVINLTGSNAGTLTSGTSIRINSDVINYTNVGAINLDLGSGLNTLTSLSPTTSPTITIAVDAGSTTTMSGLSGALPSSTILNVASGGTFSFANQNVSIDQLTGTGTVILGTGILTVGGANGSSNFGGNLTGSNTLVKIGTGTFTLSGNNSFTGTINIGSGANPAGNGNGILRITTAAAVNQATLIHLTDNNGSFDLFQLDGSGGGINLPSSVKFTLAANNAGSVNPAANVIENIAGTNSIAGAITFDVGGAGYGILSDAGSLSFTGAQTITHVLYLGGGGSGSFTGNLSGAGSLNVSTSSAWTLSGTNSYTGTTTVSTGQLILGNNAALGSTSSLSVAGAATLGLQGNVTIPGGKTFSINGAGVAAGGGLLNISGNNTWTSALALSGSGATIGVTAGQLTLSSGLTGGALSKVGNGTLLLNGANSYSAATTISGGTLTVNGSLTSATIGVANGATFNANGSLSTVTALTSNGTTNFGANVGTVGPVARTLASITIGTGGFVTVGSSTSHANRTVMVLGGLTFDGTTGLFDLADNDLIVQNGSAALLGQTNAEIAQALNTGAGYWNGTGGITSSAAASNTTFLTTLGVILNDDGTGQPIYGAASFDGQTPMTDAVLVKYTYYGDADLNGTLNGADYQQIDSGFGSGGTMSGWAHGDFNDDGVIDGSDFSLIDNTFNQLTARGTTPLAQTASPVGVDHQIEALNIASIFSDSDWKKLHHALVKSVVDGIFNLPA